MLVSGATKDVLRQRHNPNLGILTSPRGRHSIKYLMRAGLPWAMDNDAFSKQGFKPAAFMDRLYQLRDVPGCLFVCVSDVPGNAIATMRLFGEWVPFVKYLGYPVALAAQDGLEDLPIPWGLIDCLFIGGSTNWKLGAHAHALMLAARERDKWVHFGRVNSHKRMRRVKSMGACSCDGTNTSIEPRQIALKLPTAAEPVTIRMLI